MRVLVENPFSSKLALRASSSTLGVSEGKLSSGKIKGISHLSVASKSMQIKLMSAPWITLASPGTEIETMLNIVRNDMSLMRPQINWIIHDLLVNVTKNISSYIPMFRS